MLLNKGEYNGKRLLARHIVELMTTNQIGDLNVGRNKFGLGFEITTVNGQAKLGISEGSFAWGAILLQLIGLIQRNGLYVCYLCNKVRLNILKYRTNSKPWYIRH